MPQPVRRCCSVSTQVVTTAFRKCGKERRPVESDSGYASACTVPLSAADNRILVHLYTSQQGPAESTNFQFFCALFSFWRLHFRVKQFLFISLIFTLVLDLYFRYRLDVSVETVSRLKEALF